MEEWREWFFEHKNLIIIVIMIAQLLVILMFTGRWVMNVYTNSNDSHIEQEIVVGDSSSSFYESKLIEEVRNDEEVNQKWMVDIKGEVLFPGMYEVEKDMRIDDVVRMAGGVSNEADIGTLNLAQHVQDQMMIRVPSIYEEKDDTSEKETSVVQLPLPEENKTNLININTADSTELQQLSGIGGKKAEKIIIFREENGLFQNIEEIMHVSGIGEKTFEALKDYITVSP